MILMYNHGITGVGIKKNCQQISHIFYRHRFLEEMCEKKEKELGLQLSIPEVDSH